MGQSSGGFGGPNPIGDPSGAGQQGQQPGGHDPQWSAQPPTQQPFQPPQQWSPGPSAPYQQYGAPPYGATPSHPPQAWGAPGYPPQFAPPPKSRKKLFIILGAAVTAIVLVVAGVVVVSATSGSGGADSPSAAVQGYFEALARGDAAAALALGESQPVDTTFLTDDILKKQVEESPITDIKTLGETPAANGHVLVQVSVTMGGTTSSDKISVFEVDGGWKIPHAALSLDLGRNNGIAKPELYDVVTIFGKPAPKSGTAYVFPGPVEFGSSNPNIAVTNRDFDLLSGVMEVFLGSSNVSPDFNVSEEGKQAIRDVVKTKVDECARSKQLSPPDCPNGIQVSGLVDGTAEWTPPGNLDDLDADYLDVSTGLVRVSGSAEFGLKVQTDRGPYETTTTEYITGQADVMKDPPTVTFER